MNNGKESEEKELLSTRNWGTKVDEAKSNQKLMFGSLSLGVTTKKYVG